MTSFSGSTISQKIIEKAKSLGADVAGIADVDALKTSPSHRIYPKIGMNLDARYQDAGDGGDPRGIRWPPDAVSAVIIGVAHDADKPELDWWDGKGTPGNRILIRINKQLAEWIEDTFSIRTYRLPYFVEKGGIFLKDAAVLAGLGYIGKNNLVITPEFGPRIRFRALLLSHEAEAARPFDVDFCDGCDERCIQSCPVRAFQQIVYSAEALKQSILPGIDGSYDRVTCNRKMEKDIEEAVASLPVENEKQRDVRQAIDAFEGETGFKKNGHYCVKYCRQCERVCPVGKSSAND